METSAKVNVDLYSIKFSATLITASMAPIYFINARCSPIWIFCGNFFATNMLHSVSSRFVFFQTQTFNRDGTLFYRFFPSSVE